MPKSEASKVLGYGAAATAIGGAYKISEFLYKAKRLRDVGPANAVYVRLINRVRLDLDEVKRLLTVPEVKEALQANPEKAKWVYGAMRDVRGALENIAPHTERVGGDIEAGKRIGIRHRIFWLMSEKEKLENREKEVNVAHGSLMEVIGFLTALEPVDGKQHAHDKAHGEAHATHDTRNTKVDVDIRHNNGPERVEERDVWIERQDGAPRRVIEERETFIEHEHRGPRDFDEREVRIEREHRGPRHAEDELRFVRHHEPRHAHEREVRMEHEHRGPRYVDEREAYFESERPQRQVEREFEVDDHGRPVRYEERETWVEPGRGNPRYEAQYDDGRHGRVDERELHIERDPRDPRHVEARYTERGPNHYEEKRYEERRFSGAPLGRRPESFEDRVPERETWMQSEAPRGAYGDYQSRLPYEREIWVEEKEDFTHDKYGNKLPERFQQTRFPRSRM